MKKYSLKDVAATIIPTAFTVANFIYAGKNISEGNYDMAVLNAGVGYIISKDMLLKF